MAPLGRGCGRERMILSRTTGRQRVNVVLLDDVEREFRGNYQKRNN